MTRRDAGGTPTQRALMNFELRKAWSELTAPGSRFAVERLALEGRSVLHYPAAPASLSDVWEDTRAFGSRDYLVYEEEHVTYTRAHELVERVAAWLDGVGVRPRDRVAVAMRNYPEWLLIYWACVSRGVVVVGLNAWWTTEELAYALVDTQPAVMFCDGERLAQMAAIGGGAGPVRVAVRAVATDGAVGWEDVIAAEGASPPVRPEPDDDACIFYTSGTTGTAKGARLTHRGCVNNLMNMAFAAEVQALAIGRATGRAADLGAAPHPVGLATTPLFHVTATNCLAHPITAAGGTVVLMHHWDAGRALALIERERVTTMGGVPTMTREVLNHPDVRRHDLSSLTTLVGGGAALPPDLVAKIDADDLAARPSTGFGMTEATGIVTAISGEFLVDRPDSCGRAMPTFEIKVVDGIGETMPAGEAGELCVRGAGVIAGYLNQPDATAAAIDRGWLRTGDIARIDEEGFVLIVDRKKDMVIRGGENVSCAEVEAALFRHAAVAEACVFGVSDERLGEEVGAALRFRDGCHAGPAELREHLATHLARYKIPRYLWFSRGPLPRNATGKVLRRELRTKLDPVDAA